MRLTLSGRKISIFKILVLVFLPFFIFATFQSLVLHLVISHPITFEVHFRQYVIDVVSVRGADCTFSFLLIDAVVEISMVNS